jgi:hypothetical protein
MFERHINECAANDFQQKELSESLRDTGSRVIPIIASRCRGLIIAIQTAVAFGPQYQIDPTVEDWKMAQSDRFGETVKLGRLLTALVTDGVVFGCFNLNRHLAFGDLRAQDSDAGKIQHLFDQGELLFWN